jgi:hypothetical protein
VSPKLLPMIQPLTHGCLVGELEPSATTPAPERSLPSNTSTQPSLLLRRTRRSETPLRLQEAPLIPDWPQARAERFGRSKRSMYLPNRKAGSCRWLKLHVNT